MHERRHTSVVDTIDDEIRRIGDDDLCSLARSGDHCARIELWRRHESFIHSILLRENRRHNLPRTEIADARQQIYIAFHHAVERYTTHRSIHHPASFLTFLTIVIVHAFANYCAAWRLFHSHFESFSDLSDTQTSTIADSQIASGMTSDLDISHPIDWRWFSVNNIGLDSLATVLLTLDPRELQLLDAWLNLGRDKLVAEALNITPHAAKLRRERLLGRIRKRIATS